MKIHNISRYCEDVYECVATNAVGPPARREMKVSVECKYNICRDTAFSASLYVHPAKTDQHAYTCSLIRVIAGHCG